MLADDMACNARNPRPGRLLAVVIISNILSNPTLGICRKGLEIYLIGITYDAIVISVNTCRLCIVLLLIFIFFFSDPRGKKPCLLSF